MNKGLITALCLTLLTVSLCQLDEAYEETVEYLEDVAGEIAFDQMLVSTKEKILNNLEKGMDKELGKKEFKDILKDQKLVKKIDKVERTLGKAIERLTDDEAPLILEEFKNNALESLNKIAQNALNEAEAKIAGPVNELLKFTAEKLVEISENFLEVTSQ